MVAPNSHIVFASYDGVGINGDIPKRLKIFKKNKKGEICYYDCYSVAK